ncbi:hypothetical protein LAZ67_12001893 [Cordylochernes scorpioides]|uniref:Uncharacterized protein n=1 Tax=Cordylochernes scorpioides TaxID=51811 RepID=A0ABY6L3U9_9ARAC|nr:hypothetical protein LAZ67_12001893 [Cordylochernes scorpioides]
MGIKDADELLLQIEEVTDKYCRLEVKILRFTQHFHNDVNLPLSNNAVNKNYANLPKIELPIFDGKIENWISFSNIFKTTIIDNSQLTNLVKLQYLKTCLKVKALVLMNFRDIIIGKFLSDKLNNATKRSWNIAIDSNHIPSSSELLKYLENHAKALNTSETEKGLPLIKRSMKLQVHNLTKANCFLGQQEHGIYQCPTFLGISH